MASPRSAATMTSPIRRATHDVSIRTVVRAGTASWAAGTSSVPITARSFGTPSPAGASLRARPGRRRRPRTGPLPSPWPGAQGAQGLDGAGQFQRDGERGRGGNPARRQAAWIPRKRGRFLDSVGTAPDYTFQLVELVDSDLRRMSALVRQYADLRLGGTNASVVAIGERLGIVTIDTVNLRDFAAVRPRHVPAFITVPGPG